MLLKDNVAIITGGAGVNGLGFATARLMAAQGAKVAILEHETWLKNRFTEQEVAQLVEMLSRIHE